MSPIRDTSEVVEAIHQAKQGALAFCTNFFASPRKLQDWIRHQELFAEFRPGAALFLRRDRHFWHFYFSAADAGLLQQAINATARLRTEPVVTDIVGNEDALEKILPVLESSGFQRYNRLHRMTRLAHGNLVVTDSSAAQIDFAEQADAQTIWNLLDRSFDPYAEQLPALYEVEAAAVQQQILMATFGGKLAGLLWFETQGLTSTLRYWLIDELFRAKRFGAALMHRYFSAHRQVRRFSLWVISTNEKAIQKYQHYQFAPDGLLDCVLANSLISS